MHLPHTWNATGCQDGGNGDSRGPCCYTRPVLQRYYLARNGATSILDGQKLAHRDGGYGVALTGLIQRENTLCW